MPLSDGLMLGTLNMSTGIAGAPIVTQYFPNIQVYIIFSSRHDHLSVMKRYPILAAGSFLDSARDELYLFGSCYGGVSGEVHMSRQNTRMKECESGCRLYQVSDTLSMRERMHREKSA